VAEALPHGHCADEAHHDQDGDPGIDSLADTLEELADSLHERTCMLGQSPQARTR
jgi:hypothetical protein